MLATRLWMGTVLVALAVGVLVIDQWLAPWFPILFVVLLGMSVAACYELLHLLGPAHRLPSWLCVGSVAAVVAANWLPHILRVAGLLDSDPWHWVVGAFTAAVAAAFLREMGAFREPGGAVVRIALTVWATAYLALFPSFLAQLRWLDGGDRGTLALSLAIFVPKCCDIGAYFTGRFLGRTRMTPVLSPKKTWEGLAGGLAAAAAASVGLQQLGGLPRGGPAAAVGFGLAVGGAAVLGDLAESLVKRDCGFKDSARTVPGFGGVLDVVDSIVFAAPVAYFWLRL